MKQLLMMTLLMLSSMACKNLIGPDERTYASSRVRRPPADQIANPGEKSKEIKIEPLGPETLLGIWGAPCGQLNSPNKDGLSIFARDSIEFLKDGALNRSILFYADKECKTAATEDDLKTYYSGFALSEDELKAVLETHKNAIEKKTYSIAYFSKEGIADIDIAASDQSILYTSIAIFSDSIVIATECLQSMIDKTLCTDLSGDVAGRRANKIEIINSFSKL